ncbi:MAG TPA: hypothetical protein VIT62_06540 [Lysobacter sp.]
MRPDQIERLHELSQKLFDVVVVEVDPANWSGEGKVPKAMTKDERGDSVWCRKQAAASLALLTRVQALTHSLSTGQPVEPTQPEDGFGEGLDEEIGRAEREASKLLERLGVGR